MPRRPPCGSRPRARLDVCAVRGDARGIGRRSDRRAARRSSGDRRRRSSRGESSGPGGAQPIPRRGGIGRLRGPRRGRIADGAAHRSDGRGGPRRVGGGDSGVREGRRSSRAGRVVYRSVERQDRSSGTSLSTMQRGIDRRWCSRSRPSTFCARACSISWSPVPGRGMKRSCDRRRRLLQPPWEVPRRRWRTADGSPSYRIDRRRVVAKLARAGNDPHSLGTRLVRRHGLVADAAPSPRPAAPRATGPGTPGPCPRAQPAQQPVRAHLPGLQFLRHASPSPTASYDSRHRTSRSGSPGIVIRPVRSCASSETPPLPMSCRQG